MCDFETLRRRIALIVTIPCLPMIMVASVLCWEYKGIENFTIVFKSWWHAFDK